MRLSLSWTREAPPVEQVSGSPSQSRKSFLSSPKLRRSPKTPVGAAPTIEESPLQQKMLDWATPSTEVMVSVQGKLECSIATEGKARAMSFPLTHLAVTVLAFTMFEEGRFLLTHPVHRYLGPKWKKENLRVGEQPCLVDITLHHLLTHSSGLASHPITANSLQEFVDKLVDCALMFQPGEQYSLSPSTEVLGRITELVGRRTLEQLAQERVFSKLQMHTSTLVTSPSTGGYRTQLHASVGDGFGLMSALASGGGTSSAQRVLGPKTIEWMMLNHLPRNNHHAEFGVGYGALLGGATGKRWGWFEGNVQFWVDLEQQVVCMFVCDDDQDSRPKLIEVVHRII
ncbi:hypothetical protein BASA81_013835 [Batrachochytrium salamandrivorans]|nr:hypothetical protein BASA81_013835 [Batrachochytrium salamandrivorans]